MWSAAISSATRCATRWPAAAASVRGEPPPAGFERRLAERDSAAVAARVDFEGRRGRDYVRVVIAATVDAADVAEALDLAWRSFLTAAGDDAEGWDMAGATAEVRPG